MSRTKLKPNLQSRLNPVVKEGADGETYLVGYRRSSRSRKSHIPIGLARAILVKPDAPNPVAVAAAKWGRADA